MSFKRQNKSLKLLSESLCSKVHWPGQCQVVSCKTLDLKKKILQMNSMWSKFHACSLLHLKGDSSPESWLAACFDCVISNSRPHWIAPCNLVDLMKARKWVTELKYCSKVILYSIYWTLKVTTIIACRVEEGRIIMLIGFLLHTGTQGEKLTVAKHWLICHFSSLHQEYPFV